MEKEELKKNLISSADLFSVDWYSSQDESAEDPSNPPQTKIASSELAIPKELRATDIEATSGYLLVVTRYEFTFFVGLSFSFPPTR